ncbi:acyl-coenzyme A synthetase/AMP-(fatty) acid ligase [Prauserella sediminis]|uniref:Acyl-coenzyme A synthetase/AMP-(Fatty) acid ligase n=1 Tax=Prauserella sediminis TaxID=577680 RepID=A0A839XP23_9PSEU|nr:fatty acid--CoA ligase family protein [Prauserella sediminis]MBB3665592.1 acyl-coenzyme A synthetase/AMP-(fatty) acid ligase [Prauserella sediminis]
MGIRDRLRELIREAPAEAPVVEFEDDWWTWGRLHRAVETITRALDDAGVGAGARVGLVLENRPEHIAALVAVLASDRTVVTLSPLQPDARLAADVERASLPVVVGAATKLAGIVDTVTVGGVALELDQDADVSVRAGSPSAGADTAPGVAIEMLTSGTTGPPKRVRLSDRQLDESLVSSGQVAREDRLLSRAVTIAATPMVHIGGMWRVIGALSAGRRIALMAKFAVEPWVTAVERHRPKAAGLVPAGLRAVLDAGTPPARLSSLKAVTSGTTACPPDLADRFWRTYGIRVLMTYGATEFAGAVAGWTYSMHEQWWEKKAGSAGRAFGNSALRITAPDGTELATGDVGHLEVRTGQSAVGSAEWVRTSDLARIDADGFLWIEGRADDAIVRGGFKVQPAVVSAVLESHAAVREAAVAALPHERLGAVPVAGVELEPGAEMDRDALVAELVALCRHELTPYEVPAHVVVTDGLPRTPSSKVSRVDLVELVRSRIGATAGV